MTTAVILISFLCLKLSNNLKVKKLIPKQYLQRILTKKERKAFWNLRRIVNIQDLRKVKRKQKKKNLNHNLKFKIIYLIKQLNLWIKTKLFTFQRMKYPWWTVILKVLISRTMNKRTKRLSTTARFILIKMKWTQMTAKKIELTLMNKTSANISSRMVQLHKNQQLTPSHNLNTFATIITISTTETILRTWNPITKTIIIHHRLQELW